MGKIIAKFLLGLSGWKVNPVVPKEAQHSVMIAVPHTTNWDFYYTRLAFYILDIPMKVAIKDFWTKFPFSIVINPLGGVGIDRTPRTEGAPRRSYVEAMADLIQSRDRIAMVIAPEGTRKRVAQWRMGFYHTAVAAGVPITFGYLDYEKKEAGVGGVLYPSGDMAADMRYIADFYATIKGKFPQNFQLDERF